MARLKKVTQLEQQYDPDRAETNSTNNTQAGA